MGKRSKTSKKEKQIERMERSKFGMYSGPMDIGESRSTGKIDVVNLHSSTVSSSNGVGTLATELTFNPNTTVEWASFAARYREYRVLGVRVHFEPIVKVNTTGVIGGPCVVATNKAGALGTPTGHNQVFALAKSKVFSTYKTLIYEIRADDYTDLDVGDTSSPSSEFSLLLYGDAFTVSTQFFRIYILWVVQFSSVQ